MNIVARLIVLAIYLAVACGVVWFVAFGEGNESAALIFGSWGVALAHLIRIHIILELSILLSYIAFIFYLNTVLGRRSIIPVPMITGFIHGAGCVAAIFVAKPISNNPDVEVFGWLLPIIVVTIYLEVDWLLAMGEKKDWRRAICGRWRPLVGTMLGVSLLFISIFLYIFVIKIGPGEGGTLGTYFMVLIHFMIFILLPIISPIFIFRWWCRKTKDPTGQKVDKAESIKLVSN